MTDLCSCCYGKGETVQVGQTQPSLCSYCQGTGARIVPAIFPLPKTLFNDVGYKDHKYRIDAMLKSHLMVATDPDVKAPPTDEVGIRMASLDVSEGKLCAVEKEESGRFGLLEVDESSGIFNRLEVD